MAAASSARLALLPVLGLLFNAFTWGVSWWPFRQLQQQGLHAGSFRTEYGDDAVDDSAA